MVLADWLLAVTAPADVDAPQAADNLPHLTAEYRGPGLALSIIYFRNLNILFGFWLDNVENHKNGKF